MPAGTPEVVDIASVLIEMGWRLISSHPLILLPLLVLTIGESLVKQVQQFIFGTDPGEFAAADDGATWPDGSRYRGGPDGDDWRDSFEAALYGENNWDREHLDKRDEDNESWGAV